MVLILHDKKLGDGVGVAYEKVRDEVGSLESGVEAVEVLHTVIFGVEPWGDAYIY